MNEQEDGPRTESGLRPHEVEVRMVASSARVSTVRALAADVAMRADFDLDAISDVRLAADEACETVLVRAKPEGLLVCRLLITQDGVEVSASAASQNGSAPVDDSMGWRLLQMIT
ncbi:MAG: ATP-binding protein, partial [Candidatus Dormibacteraceae bacterium]